MSVTPGILQGDHFDYLPDVPADFRPFLLHDAQTMCAEGPYGNVILQYFRDQHYTAWICDIHVERSIPLRVALPASSMALLFTLTGNASFPGPLQLYEKSYTLLPPCQEAPVLKVEAGYCRMLFLLFNPLLTSLLGNISYAASPVQTGRYSESCQRLISSIHDNRDKGDIWRFKRQLLFLDLLFTSMEEITNTDREEKRSSQHRDYETLEKVKAYIHDNIGKKLSIQLLAGRFGLSPTQLRRGYKQVYKLHLASYIRNERLSQARALLHQTEMPVHEIAWEVGYESAAGFTRIFNMQFKQSPSDYRRSCRQSCCHFRKEIFHIGSAI
ncbi:helix-turn-helix domain-containing protein [Chitinophaga cymbidii]|uniref:HTH araC/xylS-type domain-containing protein n=1 Tax=Chitinophaga cymbidii TaxID=1096750 RepID=A0A512REG2_9BACT|nr:AraC family transcriptional regulator [Chitinophaga cymbidii]GEP94087.1 hypothetical protein CCY01nite_03470 [Chitinophaga cymbidii]